MADLFPNVNTLVVKIGTTLLTGPGGFDGRLLEGLVKDVARLKARRKMNVLIVSSGAVGCGMDRLGMKERPASLPLKQATAAVGQSRLMHIYEALFQTHGGGLHAAQVLLTARDLDERQGYLSIRNTLNTLFDFGNVVPIINENDSTASDELRFGDNDTLAARVAAKIGADLLIILSNVDGLYDKNPATHPDAKLIGHVEHVSAELENIAEDTLAATSVGGMKTKLSAARIACAAGLPTVIANGNRESVVSDVLAGTAPMTVFGKAATSMAHRKRWIAFGKAPRGSVVIDDGAKNALVTKGRSLLAAGVVGVEGDFEAGEAVNIRDGSGHDVARGLSNYSRGDLSAIKGLKTGQIAEKLGRKDFDEVIHRDNLVLL
jgi:glutamate 5-kinase